MTATNDDDHSEEKTEQTTTNNLQCRMLTVSNTHNSKTM